MRKTEIWVLLADAARARVVRLAGQAGEMEQAPVGIIFEAGAEHRPLRDIMTDAPGRSFASTGARRSEGSPRRGGFRPAGDLRAAPDAGDLRELMPTGLAAVVRAQVAKDRTKLPS